PSTTGASTASSRTSSIATTTKPTTPGAKSSNANDAFGSLWSAASANAGIQKKDANSSKGPNLESMAKQKFSEGIWGAASSASVSTTTATGAKPAATSTTTTAGKSSGSALDDLLG